jgi:hypothetical protein
MSAAVCELPVLRPHAQGQTAATATIFLPTVDVATLTVIHRLTPL